MDITYIGERLWVSHLGNVLTLLTFFSALLATISFYIGSKDNSDFSWIKLGRRAIYTHVAGVFSMVALLFVMLLNGMFEFHYIWKYTSSTMEAKYVFVSFWSGQEGSFILWMFWHSIIALILLRTSKKWEAPVMTVLSAVQVFLASMILGVVLLDYKIGSNPFTLLLRMQPEFANLPMFTSENYLENLDGRGLNPLLQNYWNLIHPPITFLGFALLVVPYSYAIAGLWKQKIHEWIKPVIPWTFVGISVLGTGVLMGGAWAYESLSFGGFWAWDPVENAVLVPWLTLVGAGHLMLIRNLKGSSLVTLFFLSTISFLLVLYSTFLTRSGILGETSVHSFVDLGMSGQLLLYVLFFLFLAIFLLVKNLRKFPKKEEEDALWSREFWMFIGALILLISSFQIGFTTSIPVINKLFGADGLLPIMTDNIAPPIDRFEHYHSWQIPFSIIVLLLIGYGQFLKYKNTKFSIFLSSILPSLILSGALAIGIGLALQFTNPVLILLLFTSLFAFIANLDYFIRILKGKIKSAGSSIAHIGFGLILLGALISTGKQEIISKNSSGVDISQLGEEFQNQENILLMEGDTLPMGNYFVQYNGREKDGIYLKYKIDFYQKEGEKYETAFTLFPFVQLNDRMGNVAEPSTKHFLTEDIYTHVTYADLEDKKDKKKEEVTMHEMAVGDTIFLSNTYVILKSLFKGVTDTSVYQPNENDIAVTANLMVYDFKTREHLMQPIFVLKDAAYIESIDSENENLGLTISFLKIFPETGKISLEITEDKAANKDFIIMKAIVFPYINILWLGSIIMAIGSLLAAYQRVKRNA